MKRLSNHGILWKNGQLGPFPMHHLKRVDKPTNLITENVQRIGPRKSVVVGTTPGGTSGKYPLSAAQRDIMLHLATNRDNEVAGTKAPIPEDPQILSRHIKRLGYFLKADIMGICELPKSAIYAHDRFGNPVNIDYKYAIVIVMRKEYKTMYASTGFDWIGSALSWQCYQRLGFTARTIAEYIRRLGYPALAQHAGSPGPEGYQIVIPPLLLWAGIGEVSRAGIILNPFLGLGYKAAAVLTDLPLVPDKPIDFGLQDFCQHCKVCARLCPSKAIPMGDKVVYNGYETWKLDAERCTGFNNLDRKGSICNKCVKVCPWTRPNTWSHNLVRWAVERSSLARKLAIKADDIWQGRRQAHEKDKWWFDLEDVDGLLRNSFDERT